MTKAYEEVAARLRGEIQDRVLPTAELAAGRGDDEQVDRLRAAIPGEPLRLGNEEQFVYNADFHSIVIEACGNTLLTIAAQPIFAVLQTHLARSRLGRKFHIAINEHHLEIADAIDAGNERAAREQMYEHLEFLRPYYEQAWRGGRRVGSFWAVGAAGGGSPPPGVWRSGGGRRSGGPRRCGWAVAHRRRSGARRASATAGSRSGSRPSVSRRASRSCRSTWRGQ